jgi:hypothetical protein
MANVKFSHFLFIVLLLSTFTSKIALGQKNLANNKEQQKLIKIISKNIEYPANFKESKKATVFSLKFVLSENNKVAHIFSSEETPVGMVSNLTEIKTYDTIDWTEIISRKIIDKGTTLIVPITVTPDDNVSGLPNFTLDELGRLFKYDNANDRDILISFIMQPLTLQYREAKK